MTMNNQPEAPQAAIEQPAIIVVGMHDEGMPVPERRDAGSCHDTILRCRRGGADTSECSESAWSSHTR